jgi:hypothetical protein
MSQTNRRRSVLISVVVLAVSVWFTAWITRADAGSQQEPDTHSLRENWRGGPQRFLAPPGDSRSDASELQSNSTPAAGAAQETGKTAGEVYKNIQLFKTMPASGLMGTMKALTRLLGVDCSHCHVVGEFEKDDKPPKQTARNMFRMMEKIDNDYFGGKDRISCWTCHRGQPQPELLPPAQKSGDAEDKNKN